MKKILFLLILNPFFTYAENQESGKGLNFFNNSKTSIQNPFQLRDPFKRKRIKLKKRGKTFGTMLQNGKFSNSLSLDGVPLNLIRVVGVLLGDKRRAIAKIIQNKKLSNHTYTLKEGMSLGENNAEIKAILPGGIVLVEKIMNVYDQEEYIETIIPVSSYTN